MQPKTLLLLLLRKAEVHREGRILSDKIKKYSPFLMFGFLTQLFSILLPPNSNISGTNVAFCNYYINKWNILNVHIDCDSQYFLLDSQNPLRLLSSETPLQDRPLHILFVSLISRFLEFIGVPSGSITYLGEDSVSQTYNVLDYGVYIGTNVLILGISIFIVMRILLRSVNTKSTITRASMFLALAMIVQNPVNREFFWTPHSQIFNILIPAILFQFVQKDLILTTRRFWLYFGLFGALSLFYPTFSIVLPIFFVLSWRKLGKAYGFLSLFILLPRFLWPRIIELLGGDYVDWPVVGHRRFIWILDSYRKETLANDSADNLWKFLTSLPVHWLAITVLLVLLSILIHKQSRKGYHFSTNNDVSLAYLAVATYSVGLILNGEYGQRFTTGLVLLISFIVMNQAIQLNKQTKPIILCLFGIIGLNCWHWVIW